MSEKVLAINELNEQLLTLSNQFNESERRYLAQGATLERKQQ